MPLVGLAETRKSRPCKYFTTPTGALRLIRKKMAACYVTDYGCLTVWDTKDGAYRCVRHVHMVARAEAKFTNLKAVARWLKEQMPLIDQPS